MQAPCLSSFLSGWLFWVVHERRLFFFLPLLPYTSKGALVGLKLKLAWHPACKRNIKPSRKGRCPDIWDTTEGMFYSYRSAHLCEPGILTSPAEGNSCPALHWWVVVCPWAKRGWNTAFGGNVVCFAVIHGRKPVVKLGKLLPVCIVGCSFCTYGISWTIEAVSDAGEDNCTSNFCSHRWLRLTSSTHRDPVMPQILPVKFVFGCLASTTWLWCQMSQAISEQYICMFKLIHLDVTNGTTTQ